MALSCRAPGADAKLAKFRPLCRVRSTAFSTAPCTSLANPACLRRSRRMGLYQSIPRGRARIEGLEFGQDTVNISAVSRVSDQRATRAPDGVSVRAWYRNHCLDRQVSETWLRLLSRP